MSSALEKAEREAQEALRALEASRHRLQVASRPPAPTVRHNNVVSASIPMPLPNQLCRDEDDHDTKIDALKTAYFEHHNRQKSMASNDARGLLARAHYDFDKALVAAGLPPRPKPAAAPSPSESLPPPRALVRQPSRPAQLARQASRGVYHVVAPPRRLPSNKERSADNVKDSLTWCKFFMWLVLLTWLMVYTIVSIPINERVIDVARNQERWLRGECSASGPTCAKLSLFGRAGGCSMASGRPLLEQEVQCGKYGCTRIQFRLSLKVELRTRDGTLYPGTIAHRYPLDRYWDYEPLNGGSRTAALRAPSAMRDELNALADHLDPRRFDCWYDPADPTGTVALSSASVPFQSYQEAVTGRVFGYVFAVPLVALVLWLWWLPCAAAGNGPVCCCCPGCCECDEETPPSRLTMQ